MIVQCAWCKKDMGKKEPLEEEVVSHGICPECMEMVMADAQADKGMDHGTQEKEVP